MYQEKIQENTPRRLSFNNRFTLIVVLILVILSFIGRQVVITQANNTEVDMNTQFAVCLRALGSYYTDAEASLGIAKANSADLVKIITAVSTHSNASYTALPISNPQNQVYIDLQRAYPDLKNSSDFYKNAEALMVGDYANYTANGNKMSEMIGAFDKVHNGAFGFLLGGYPNDILRAQPDATQPVVHGQAAYDIMSAVITDQNVGKSYNKGYTVPVFNP